MFDFLVWAVSRNLALNRAPDTYVKLNLVSSTGQELAHSKTTVRRGQPNPLFKETFVFQVSIYHKFVNLCSSLRTINVLCNILYLATNIRMRQIV